MQEPGVFGTIQTAKEQLSATRAWREEAQAWKRAYNELKMEISAFRQEMEDRFANMELRLGEERSAYERKLRQASMPGIGLFAGFGVTPNGNGEFVAGIGIVWKIW